MTTSATSSIASLCDEVRQMTSRSSISPEQVRDLAQRYNDAVRQTNERLKRAHQWLRKGLRTEAVHLAMVEPNVIDAAAGLELGYARSEWMNLCAEHGGDDPLAVDLDAAAQLDDAARKESEIAELVARHRALALRGAGLAERLRVLVELAGAEPDVPTWNEQRRLLEKERLVQISREAQQASERGDHPALIALVKEVRSDRWIDAPPQEIVEDVARRQRELQVAVTHRELEVLADEMHEAHGAFDSQRVARAIAQWDRLIDQRKVVPNTDLQAGVESTRTWLLDQLRRQEAEDEYQKLCEELRFQLDEHAPFPGLQKLHSRLSGMEAGVPDALEQRYQSRWQSFAIDRRRRHRLAALGVLGVVIIVGGLIGWTIWGEVHDRTVQEWSQRIRGALDAGDMDQAERWLDEVDVRHQRVASDARIVELRQEFTSLYEDARRADEAFEAQMTLVRDLAPSDPALDTALERALEFARTSDQKTEVETERARIVAARLAAQRAIDEPFERERESIQRRVDAITTDIADPQARVEAFEEQRDAIDALLETEGVSQEVRDGAVALRQRVSREITDIRDALNREEAIVAALEGIGNARSVERLETLLREFVTSFPEAPEARQFFGPALENAPSWRAVDAWRELRGQLGRELRVQDAESAVARVALIEQFRLDHPSAPNLDAAVEYKRYLERAAETLDPAADNLTIEALREFMAMPWAQDLVSVVDIDERRHYSLGGELIAQDGARRDNASAYQLTEYVQRLDQLPLASPDRGRRLLWIEQGQDGLQPAPHVDAAEAVAERLASFDGTGWETLHLELAMLFAEVREIDPILRAIWIHDRLERQRKAGWHQSREAEDLLERLRGLMSVGASGAGIGSVNWPDATDTEVARLRRMAADAVADAEAVLRRALDDAEASWQSMTEGLHPLQLAGVLRPGAGGEPAVSGARGSGGLFIATLVNGRTELVRIGSASSGSTNVAVPEGTPYGTPVFVTAPKAP